MLEVWLRFCARVIPRLAELWVLVVCSFGRTGKHFPCGMSLSRLLKCPALRWREHCQDAASAFAQIDVTEEGFAAEKYFHGPAQSGGIACL